MLQNDLIVYRTETASGIAGTTEFSTFLGMLLIYQVFFEKSIKKPVVHEDKR
jgi:hypothetical protein